MLKKLLNDLLPADAKLQEKIFFVLNLSIPILMGIYVFANPLPAASINEICFYLSCAALIALLIFRKTNFTLRSPMTPPFALFLTWSLVGLFFALDPTNSIHDLRGHLLKYLIIFYFLVNFFSTKSKLEILSLILIAGATVFSLGGMIGFYVVEGFPLSERLGLTFKGMAVNYSGFITVFAVVLAGRHFFEQKTILYKGLFGICILANVTATLLTQSRGSFVGLVVALLILCFANKKNIIFALVLIVIFALMPGMKTRVQTEGLTRDFRVKIYRLTYEVIRDHPIMGIGFGMQTLGNKDLVPLEDYNRKLPPPYRQQNIVTTPHNMFLDIAVRTGLVGLILFMCILLTAIGMLWIIWKRNPKDEYFRSWAIYLLAGFMSFITQSFFADAAFGPRAVTFYTILAMIAILWNLASKNEQSLINAGGKVYVKKSFLK